MECNRLEQLMVEVQSGDQHSYELLLLEAYKILRSYLLKFTKNLDLIEDCIQSTLLSMHRARHTYTPGRPFLPWLLSIARRKFVDAVRSNKHQYESISTETMPMSTSMQHVEAQLDIAAIVEQFPELEWKLIQLLHVDGRSVGEISQLMNITEASVKVKIHRSLMKIRTKIFGK